MHIRVTLAVVTSAGLILAGCGTSEEAESSLPEVQIEAASPEAGQNTAAADETADSAETGESSEQDSSELLVVEPDEESQSSDTTSSSAASSSSASSSTASSAGVSSTTAAPATTAASSTTAQATTTEQTATTAKATTTAQATTTEQPTSTEQTTTTAAPTTAAPTTTEPTTTTEQVSVLETRDEVLRLAGLPTFSGGSFNPDSMSTKNIVLWFWGAHWSTCQREAATVAAAAQQHGDLYTFIGLPLAEGENAINDFIVGREVQGITHVLGTDSLWGSYGALGTPSWMTINRSGETKVGIGALTPDVINGTWVS